MTRERSSGSGPRAGAARPSAGRFADVTDRKATGATYTPPELADYLATKLVAHALDRTGRGPVRVLDPAIGDGALVIALARALSRVSAGPVEVVGYETSRAAADAARRAIAQACPAVCLELRERDFLGDDETDRFDLAIANPPYVRTQILGVEATADLARRFGLAGRLDLYQAFALAIAARLDEDGSLALITSNRFLTTKGAAAFRDALRRHLTIARVWDLGDTKLFEATVLPAMILGSRGTGRVSARDAAEFTSIYETTRRDVAARPSLGEALDHEGEVSLGSRTFRVSQGRLRVDAGAVWRMSSARVDAWLETVQANTWKPLGAIGKIRVGVKSTADRVFIRDDWSEVCAGVPELLRPLLTHHVARRYRAVPAVKQILYPHLDEAGHRSVADLAAYPNAATYLESHRRTLEARPYLQAAGRRWYELWVPHEPATWARDKLVFRDIAETPTFFLDDTGSVVNGDCYWLVADDADLLFLALAVSNSRFIEAFYDHRFNNKLFGGRRRFMTQYVAEFPLPDPSTDTARAIISLARARHRTTGSHEALRLEAEIDALVWSAFGHLGGGEAISSVAADDAPSPART